MSKSGALLFVKLDPPEKNLKEFNEWYNKRHIPDRLALPGVLSARRFTLVKGVPQQYAIAPEAEYLALYDLAGVKTLLDKPYQELRAKEAKRGADSFETLIFKLPRFTRAIYEQIYPEKPDKAYRPGKFLMVVGHDVPRSRHQEFNAWYNTEHIQSLLAVPGFMNVRRFRLNERDIPPVVDRDGTVSQYMTIWEIESDKAVSSEAFTNAAKSPWSDWVRSWYTRKICAIYRGIFP